MKRLFALIFATAFALSGVMTQPAAADQASQRSNAPTIAALVDAHNAQRAANNLPALKFVPTVSAEVSQPWAISMRNAGTISHNRDFRWPGATGWSENVGWNVGHPDPVARMMADFMDSADHRANILEPSNTHIAVGAVRDGNELYAAVNFYRGDLTNAGTAYDSGSQWLVAVNTNINPVNPADPDHVYSKTGTYAYNNRLWRVECEPYSATERCRTDIWATVIVHSNGDFQRSTQWAFNNLTYQPSERSIWRGNPLATPGNHQINGRNWRTECDTPVTGRNGCRSYIETRVVTATPLPGGGDTFSAETQYVFNNIVRFK